MSAFAGGWSSPAAAAPPSLAVPRSWTSTRSSRPVYPFCPQLLPTPIPVAAAPPSHPKPAQSVQKVSDWLNALLFL